MMGKTGYIYIYTHQPKPSCFVTRRGSHVDAAVAVQRPAFAG